MDSNRLFKDSYTVSFQDTESFQVRRDLYKPNPEKPGYLSLDRVLSNSEVKEYINDALKQISVTGNDNEEMTALSCAEYFMYDDKESEFELDKPFPFPQSQVLVTCGYGHNEGALLRILVQDSKTGDFKCFASVKYFIDINTASKISLALNEAFNNGLYN